MEVEVEVLDAKAEPFHQAEARAIEEADEETVPAVHPGEHPLDLGLGEHDRQLLSPPGPGHIAEVAELPAEDMRVEEDEGAERLALGGRRHVALDGEVGEEGVDLVGAHLVRVARSAFRVTVEEAEAPDPVRVGLFGAVAVVAEAAGSADTRKELVPAGSRAGVGSVHGAVFMRVRIPLVIRNASV